MINLLENRCLLAGTNDLNDSLNIILLSVDPHAVICSAPVSCDYEGVVGVIASAVDATLMNESMHQVLANGACVIFGVLGTYMTELYMQVEHGINFKNLFSNNAWAARICSWSFLALGLKNTMLDEEIKVIISDYLSNYTCQSKPSICRVVEG